MLSNIEDDPIVLLSNFIKVVRYSFWGTIPLYKIDFSNTDGCESYTSHWQTRQNQQPVKI